MAITEAGMEYIKRGLERSSRMNESDDESLLKVNTAPGGEAGLRIAQRINQLEAEYPQKKRAAQEVNDKRVLRERSYSMKPMTCDWDSPSQLTAVIEEGRVILVINRPPEQATMQNVYLTAFDQQAILEILADHLGYDLLRKEN